MAGEVSKLINDLSSVPSIVGGLGLSIAAAQKAFNLDYMENLEKLVAMAKGLMDHEALDTTKKAKAEAFKSIISEMVLALAPSRYQFTETTLTVKLDLAQTMSQGEQLGLGVNVGAVAINAAMTSAFGYDYRAAAEVKTVIHAISPNAAAFKKLLDQASEIHASALTLPSAATVDENIISTTNRIFNKLVNVAENDPEVPSRIVVPTPAPV